MDSSGASTSQGACQRLSRSALIHPSSDPKGAAMDSSSASTPQGASRGCSRSAIFHPSSAPPAAQEMNPHDVATRLSDEAYAAQRGTYMAPMFAEDELDFDATDSDDEGEPASVLEITKSAAVQAAAEARARAILANAAQRFPTTTRTLASILQQNKRIRNTLKPSRQSA